MDKASDFGSEDWGFESLRGRMFCFNNILFSIILPFLEIKCRNYKEKDEKTRTDHKEKKKRTLPSLVMDDGSCLLVCFSIHAFFIIIIIIIQLFS